MPPSRGNSREKVKRKAGEVGGMMVWLRGERWKSEKWKEDSFTFAFASASASATNEELDRVVD